MVSQAMDGSYSRSVEVAHAANKNGIDFSAVASPTPNETPAALTKSKDGAQAQVKTDFNAIAKSVQNGTPNLSQLITGPAPSHTVELKHTIIDATASISASIAGAATYGLTSAKIRSVGTIPMAMTAGSVTEYSVKAGLEHLLLDQKDYTANRKDLAWGAVDGLAGVAGGIAERKAAEFALRRVAKGAIGDAVSPTLALQAGKDLVHDSVGAAIKVNLARGLAGGTAASFVWSAPRRTDENIDLIKAAPLAGTANAVAGIMADTALGGVTGGIFGAGGTALFRSPEIAGATVAKFRNTDGYKFIDVLAVNDFHSDVYQLPKIKTVADAIIGDAHAKGRTVVFTVPGDPLSGHVNFAFTKNGQVEYKALSKVGENADATIFGLGNHEYDAPGGRFNPERYPGVIEPILRETPNAHLVNANMDVSAIPGFEPLIKRSMSIPLRNSVDRLGFTSVTTEEGAIGGIVYNDALQAARREINNLNLQDIKLVHMTTHIGAHEDEQLARGLLSSHHQVLLMNGGHSHTVIPTLRWIGSKETLAQKMQFWKPTDWIPVSQAGNSGRWLSHTQLAIKPDGTLDRWLTRGRLIPITDKVAENPAMKAMLDSELEQVTQLKATTYNANIVSNYSLRGTRLKETAIGNLYADGLHTQVARHTGVQPDITLVHSGGIRNDLYKTSNVNRLDLSNIVMNAGNPAGEQLELTMVNLKGSEIKRGLEFAVSDMSPAAKPSWSQRIRTLLGAQPSEHPFDPSGNFMQVSGMRYTFDLRRPVGDRVVDIGIQKGAQVTPLDPNASYTVLARWHAMDKWIKHDVFGANKTIHDAYAEIGAKAVTVSQVDLIGDYIRNKTLDPKVVSAVDGRIKNLTPKAGNVTIQLGPYQTAPGVLTIADPHRE